MVEGPADTRLTADSGLRDRLLSRLAGTTPPADPAAGRLPPVQQPLLEQIRDLLPETPIPAAVLVPVFDRPQGLQLLFTQRASQLRRHAGQVSFPGGRIERHDTSLTDAALRETEEEIGLSREHVAVIGYLRPLLILTGYSVTPVIGLVTPGSKLRLDPTEVEAVFEVPLSHIVDPANRLVRERELGRVRLPTIEFHYEGRVIWGATAAMLVALVDLLSADTDD